MEQNFIERDSNLSDDFGIEKSFISFYFLYQGKNTEDRSKEVLDIIYAWLIEINKSAINKFNFINFKINPKYSFVNYENEKSKYIIKSQKGEVIKEILNNIGSAIIDFGDMEFSLRHQRKNNDNNLELAKLNIFEEKNNKYFLVNINIDSILMLISELVSIKDVQNNS